MAASTRSDSAAAAIAIAVTILTILVSCSVWLWPGAPSRDVVSNGVGGPETCYRRDVENARNRFGDAAIVRAAYCPGQDPVDVGYVFFVVFVHPMNEPNARDNIALQYVPDTDDLSPSAAQPPADAPWAYGLTQPPVVKWLGKRLEVVTPGIVQTTVQTLAERPSSHRVYDTSLSC